MESKEVIIDGIVYVPKEPVKENKDSTPSFKVGDWVIGKEPGDFPKEPRRIIRQEEDFYRWTEKEIDDSQGRGTIYEYLRLATHEEIETYLIDEAERRGYKVGVIALDAHDGLKSRLTTLEGYRPIYDSLNFNCDPIGNEYTSCNVYYKGKWAEIVTRPLPKTVEELTSVLNEYIESSVDKAEEFAEQFR